MFTGKVFPGAGIVLEREGKVLMTLILRKDHIRWELPAGRAEDRETMAETAIREGYEETHLRIHIISPIALCWHYSLMRQAGWYGLFFSAATSDHEGKIPAQEQLNSFDFQRLQKMEQQGRIDEIRRSLKRENILAVGFVEWSKIDKRRIHPLHCRLLEKYFEDRPKKFIFLAGDGEQDYIHYSKDVPIFY